MFRRSTNGNHSSQVGFLIVLDKRRHKYQEARKDFASNTLPESFSFVFVQDNDAYFKNEDMRQLDEDIGDLDSFIKDTESLITSELEDDILDCEMELRSTFSALAELDCILSLTSCAADFNFARPEVVASATSSDSVIYIENGRHPLQELIVDDEFIKNDTMVDHQHRINMITGPNFSGKSCYTRQVGVLVYMAHIGSFLPCDKAKISVTDQILARIASVESCAVPQSSFQLDLTQMAVILRQSTAKSLVLIDEFGKGT
jgi:DNA mismatch repair protein MSH5